MDDILKRLALTVLATVGAKDPLLRRHCEQVALIAVNMAHELEPLAARTNDIWLGGIIHDVGKVGIPTRVLHKEGALDYSERKLIESHVAVGLDILREGAFPWEVLTLVAQHHERLDGSGYPNGLKGDEIALGGLVLGLADAFDALTSARPYRAGFSVAEARRYLDKHGGPLFGPAAVDALGRVLSRMEIAASR